MLAIDGNSVWVYVLAGLAAAVLLWIGYRIGRIVSGISHKGQIATKEQEMLTAQRGFKTLYEQDLEKLKIENEVLKERLNVLEARVEAYRKKAAGFGLFGSAGKRAEAMYALLLENEQLEEALHAQNEKLRDERTAAINEQLRATGYRRILISQLMSDERIKGLVSDVITDEKKLPPPAKQEI